MTIAPGKDGLGSPAAHAKRNLDWLSRMAGAAFALIGLASIAEVWWHELALWDESGPGPAFAPALLGIILMFLGLVIASGRVAASDDADRGDKEHSAPRAMIKFSLLLIALIVSFSVVGGVLSLSLFVAAEMRLVERSSPRAAIASGIIAFAVIWLIFIEILAVPLPPGVLALFGS